MITSASFLIAITKVLFLEKRLGTGLFLHPILNFLIFPYLLRYHVLSRLVTHEATHIMCFYGSINIALLAGMGTFLK